MFGPNPTPCTIDTEYAYWKDKKTVSLLVAIAVLAIGLIVSLVMR